MHYISNLFYFVTTLYMFRSLRPSLGVQDCTYSIRYMSYRFCGCLLRVASTTGPEWYDAVCAVLDSWWWTERPSETCRVLFQNKINLRYCAFDWFYYGNITMHGPTNVTFVGLCCIMTSCDVTDLFLVVTNAKSRDRSWRNRPLPVTGAILTFASDRSNFNLCQWQEQF